MRAPETHRYIANYYHVSSSSPKYSATTHSPSLTTVTTISAAIPLSVYNGGRNTLFQCQPVMHTSLRAATSNNDSKVDIRQAPLTDNNGSQQNKTRSSGQHKRSHFQTGHFFKLQTCGEDPEAEQGELRGDGGGVLPCDLVHPVTGLMRSARPPDETCLLVPLASSQCPRHHLTTSQVVACHYLSPAVCQEPCRQRLPGGV